MKDPVANFELFLLQEKVLNEAHIAQIKEDFKADIQHSFDEANAESAIVPSLTQELSDLYATFS